MTDIPQTNELEDWHHYFAAQCNNSAWDLASQDELSDDQADGLLNAAFAAAYHWSKVGEPINGARADVTLAHAHAVLAQRDGGEGLAARAMFYARRSLNYFNTHPCEDWDLAFAHAEVAYAAAASGDAYLHKYHHQQAARLGKDILEDEDRAAFLDVLGKVPKP